MLEFQDSSTRSSAPPQQVAARRLLVVHWSFSRLNFVHIVMLWNVRNALQWFWLCNTVEYRVFLFGKEFQKRN